MIKEIQVTVDRQSWLSTPTPYRKVCPFVSQGLPSSVDFRRAMLWAGLMSVSPRMPQWWTASQWAILRYFGAVDGTVGALRLHRAVDEIDIHPKKVLSDDWGIGVGLEWLDSQFQYAYVQHGRRAMDELQALGIATFAEFFALSVLFRWVSMGLISPEPLSLTMRRAAPLDFQELAKASGVARQSLTLELKGSRPEV